LNTGVWFRRGRLLIVSPVRGHHRRYQAETPLIPLSRFAEPALSAAFCYGRSSSNFTATQNASRGSPRSLSRFSRSLTSKNLGRHRIALTSIHQINGIRECRRFTTESVGAHVVSEQLKLHFQFFSVRQFGL
jgi:hypothetical protein